MFAHSCVALVWKNRYLFRRNSRHLPTLSNRMARYLARFIYKLDKWYMTSRYNRVISCEILHTSHVVADISLRYDLSSVYVPLLGICERASKAIHETFTCDSAGVAKRLARFLRSKRRGGVIRFCTAPDHLEESLHGTVADNGGTLLFSSDSKHVATSRLVRRDLRARGSRLGPLIKTAENFICRVPKFRHFCPRCSPRRNRTTSWNFPGFNYARKTLPCRGNCHFDPFARWIARRRPKNHLARIAERMTRAC